MVYRGGIYFNVYVIDLPEIDILMYLSVDKYRHMYDIYYLIFQ